MDAKVVAGQIEDVLPTNQVYGEPVTTGGVTLVPAARVGGGAGGGSGHDTKGEGEGLGTGFGARPTGAFVLREGEVRWLPAVDVNRLVVAVAVVLVAALSAARGIVAALAARRPA